METGPEMYCSRTARLGGSAKAESAAEVTNSAIRTCMNAKRRRIFIGVGDLFKLKLSKSGGEVRLKNLGLGFPLGTIDLRDVNPSSGTQLRSISV
jgi:hypothetical protein